MADTVFLELYSRERAHMIMPQEFYTGSLIAVIAVISICVLTAIHMLGVKHYAPVALRVYQFYFISGGLGWVLLGLMEFAHLQLSLSWLAVAYFCAACLLLFILYEQFQLDRKTLLWLTSHCVFIVIVLSTDTLVAQVWIFTLYIMLHVSVLCLVAFKSRQRRLNVGYNIITLAVFLPWILGITQCYLLLNHFDPHFVVGLGVSGAATSYSLVGLGFMTMMILKQRDAFAQKAQNDALTGLYNRYGLSSALEHLVAASQRESSLLSVVIIDIDHFKKINDTYGHDVGDKVLKKFARTLKKLKRGSDLSARTGGEEFILVLPKTDLDNAMKLAERIRKTVAAMTLEFSNHTIKLTASFGVAGQRGVNDIDALIKSADKALYDAKAQGRNRTCMAKMNG